MERRRVHATELGAIPLDIQFSHTVTIDESNGLNIHGLRWEVSIVTTGSTVGASQGTWAVFCLPDEASNLPNVDIADFEAEGSNAFTWGIGTWEVSNATPTKILFSPKTTRNCQNGARIVFKMKNNVSTGTSPSVASVVTFFTKSL